MTKKTICAIVTIVRRTIMITALVALVVTNFLSVTSAKFNEMLHDLLALTPAKQLLLNSPVNTIRQTQAKHRSIQATNSRIRTENERLKSNNSKLLAKQKEHKRKVLRARQISKSVTRRTAKNLAKNVASIPAEAIPYLGAATLVTVTALDVKDGCNTVRDINEMMELLEAEPLDADVQKVCGIKVPSIDSVFATMKQDLNGTADRIKSEAQIAAHHLYEHLERALNELTKE